MKFYIPFILCVLLMMNSFADKEFKANLGKVSTEELTMTHCSIDSGANAAILFDIGKSEVKFEADRGFSLEFTRHVRIKVFNKEGYDHANIEIMLYKSDNDAERLTSFKGYTHNLEGKAKEKEKISKGDGITEEISKHWIAEKYTMPNVKEGSVIEYEYTISSPFLFQLQDWQMQYSIPVLRSDYTAIFPEYFWYTKHYRGAMSLDEEEYSTSTFRGVGVLRDEAYVYKGSVSRTDTKPAAFEYMTHKYHFVSLDTPGLKKEPYMPDIDNYFAEISFELAYTDFPGGLRKNYTLEWEDVNETLMTDPDFGLQLNNSGYAKSFLNPMLMSVKDTLAVAVNIFNHVRDYMKWNGMRSIYVTSNLRNAYRDKAGNSADINLMLVSLLREAGIESFPILVSTRDNGFVQQQRPSITQFNYVIALTWIDGMEYFLDATDADYPFGMLPERCLNGLGRLVNDEKGEWVNVMPSGIHKEIISSGLLVKEDGILTGKISKIKSDYSAIDFRIDVKEANNLDDFISSLSEKNPGLKITSYNIENLDSLEAPVTVDYEILLDNHSQSIGDFIYINPLITERIEDNPFKPELRVYPVDMIYPLEQIVSINITVPQDYDVESLPQSSAIKLPEKGGMFLYSCNMVGNNISVTCRLSLAKALFPQNEYPYIREFFNQVVTKHAEQIVLKKKS